MKHFYLYGIIPLAALVLGGCVTSSGSSEQTTAQPFDSVYESAEHLLCSKDGIRLSKVVKNLVEDDFSAENLTIWEPIINFEDRIEFAYGEKLGTRGLVLTTTKGGDTAFELRTKPFAVNAGSDFLFRIGVRGSVDLERSKGHSDNYHNQIVWLNADDEQIGFQPFTYETVPEKVSITSIPGKVPENAAKAYIRFGADSPNIVKGSFVVYTHISFCSTEKESRQWPTGYFISRPFLTPNSGKISWNAEIPHGTSLAVQLATAPDDHGMPGVWSPFGGEGLVPDKAFLKNGAKLPPFPNSNPWMRYKVTFTGNNSKSPLLKSIQIGEISDGNWVGEDTTPPVIEKRFSSQTEDASAPISFAIQDQTRVEWRTLELTMDGKDITSQLKRNSNVITYTPASPLKPVMPEFSNFNDWELKNIANRLTITMLRENQPGLYVTREEETDVDTMFAATSPKLSVKGGAEYRFTVEVRHNLALSAKGAPNVAPMRIVWLDKKGNPLEETPTLFTPDCRIWTPVTLTATAPEGADRAQVIIRIDVPNIFGGKYYHCRNPKWEGPEGIPVKLPPNLHIFDLKVSDAAGNEANKKFTLIIDKPLTRNIVTLRQDGCVLVDGKPFFPIGIYAVIKREFNENNLDKAVYDLKNAGFNLIHTYACQRNENFKELVEAAEKYGMKMFVSSRKGSNSLDAETFLKDIANEYRSPAAFAWYLADDTSGYVNPNKLRMLHEALHELDPYHITVQADGVHVRPDQPTTYHDYVHSTDGYLPEIYPVRKGVPVEQCVPRVILDMKALWQDIADAGSPAKTVWPIIQYFDGWNSWERFPTFEELRAMSYLGIIHGGNGITWYTYGGFNKNHGITATPEIWNNMKTVATELNKLSSVFVVPSNGKTITPQILEGEKKDALGFDSISVLYKDLGKRQFLICANSSLSNITVSFDTKEAEISPDVAKVWFEDRTVKMQKGVFEDTFAPNAVHVYELKGLFD